MAGRHNWSELRTQMSAERRERNERAAAAMLAALELNELRQARQLTRERAGLSAVQPSGPSPYSSRRR